jgi:AcrR family transcriptional regulator
MTAGSPGEVAPYGEIGNDGLIMSNPTARERLAQAAFALFDERGYEQTTVDEITERAGLGRTTFFRHYRSKEDVIFPDHDRLLQRVSVRLRSPGSDGVLAAVSDAVRLVLQSYLDEGDIARRRYALTSSVPALRDREIVSVGRYQRVFREFIADSMEDRTELSQLRAELTAAATVAAHNHVLRRWLRGDNADPLGELDVAMRQVGAFFDGHPPGPGATIAVFRTGEDVDSLLPALRRLTGDENRATACRGGDRQYDG